MGRTVDLDDRVRIDQRVTAQPVDMCWLPAIEHGEAVVRAAVEQHECIVRRGGDVDANLPRFQRRRDQQSKH